MNKWAQFTVDTRAAGLAPLKVYCEDVEGKKLTEPIPIPTIIVNLIVLDWPVWLDRSWCISTVYLNRYQVLLNNTLFSLWIAHCCPAMYDMYVCIKMGAVQCYVINIFRTPG